MHGFEKSSGVHALVLELPPRRCRGGAEVVH
jgi:hypothetical protein